MKDPETYIFEEPLPGQSFLNQAETIIRDWPGWYRADAATNAQLVQALALLAIAQDLHWIKNELEDFMNLNYQKTEGK